jgi:PTH2 family peptidyl-tRNA hydrolase
LKQAIVVRSDLKMGKGKMASQVAHASLQAAEDAMRTREKWFGEWKEGGQAKIVLKVGSEGELEELLKKAKSLRIPVSLIQDRGLTQLEPGTTTSMAVGPAPDELVDRVTGKLKLL